MTNEKIIYNTAINAGIFTKAEATAILAAGQRLPLHTYSEWKRMGYQVKEGEHAAVVAWLWKWKEGKKTGEIKEVPGLFTENGQPATVECEESSHHFKQKAYLFTAEQVERRPQVVKKDLVAYNKMLAEQRKSRANVA